MMLGDGKYVDAEKSEGMVHVRFINHQCESYNCKVEKYVDDNENTKLVIRAIRDIETGIELSYCYDVNTASFGFQLGCKCSDCEVHRASLELDFIKEKQLFLKRNVWAGLKKRDFVRLSQGNLMNIVRGLNEKQNRAQGLCESQKLMSQHELCRYILNQL